MAETSENAEDSAAPKKLVKSLPPGISALPPGVCWKKNKYSFYATRPSDGKTFETSVRKYGLQKALQLATEFVEKDRAALAAAEKAARPSLWAARHRPQQL